MRLASIVRVCDRKALPFLVRFCHDLQYSSLCVPRHMDSLLVLYFNNLLFALKLDMIIRYGIRVRVVTGLVLSSLEISTPSHQIWPMDHKNRMIHIYG